MRAWRNKFWKDVNLGTLVCTKQACIIESDDSDRFSHLRENEILILVSKPLSAEFPADTSPDFLDKSGRIIRFLTGDGRWDKMLEIVNKE